MNRLSPKIVCVEIEGDAVTSYFDNGLAIKHTLEETFGPLAQFLLERLGRQDPIAINGVCWRLLS
jgi:hypothetical protein